MVLADEFADVVAQASKFVAGTGDGPGEAFPLLAGVGGPRGDRPPPLVEAIDDVGLPQADARTERLPLKGVDACVESRLALGIVSHLGHTLQEPGIAHHRGELGRDAYQQARLIGLESPLLDSLDDEDTL